MAIVAVKKQGETERAWPQIEVQVAVVVERSKGHGPMRKQDLEKNKKYWGEEKKALGNDANGQLFQWCVLVGYLNFSNENGDSMPFLFIVSLKKKKKHLDMAAVNV